MQNEAFPLTGYVNIFFYGKKISYNRIKWFNKLMESITYIIIINLTILIQPPKSIALFPFNMNGIRRVFRTFFFKYDYCPPLEPDTPPHEVEF